MLFLLLGLFTLASLVFYHSGDLSFYSSHPNRPVLNYTGLTGAYLAFGLFLTFGASAFLIPLIFLLWSSCFFMQRIPERKFFKFLGLGIAMFSAATIIAISVNPELRLERGGAIGYLAGTQLLRYFGHLGSFILAASCLLLSMLLATDFLLYPLFKNAMKRLQKMTRGFSDFRENFQELFAGIRIPKQRPTMENLAEKVRTKSGKEIKSPTLPDMPLKVKKYRPDLPEQVEPANEAKKAVRPERKEVPKVNKEVAMPTGKAEGGGEEIHREGVIGSKGVAAADYKMPPIDLLEKPVAGAVKSDDLQGNSRILEKTLAEFGIEVKVTEVEQGPVITRYELLPAPGVKVNSITALQDDLALALKAHSLRIIAPIPGKAAVGVEMPNSESSTVSLRELVESNQFRTSKAHLPLVLGKDTSGKSLITDLAKMPHLLIAGTTGSGKTVCVNSIITALLYKLSPDQLKFVMIDPKMVELAVYNTIPHMLSPVVTNVRKAPRTLNWVVSEMENRYQLFAKCGVRNIASFNSRAISDGDRDQLEQVDSNNVMPARIPYIIVVIDELADLMLCAQDKVEASITRLAQLSRAVGIHLILATQRPSVDVITGVIKANFPARISFKVASKVDSRTVLDAIGADKLIGRGDMLFQQPGDAKPTRGQAPLVTDEEINRVVKFVSQQAKPEYHPEILSAQEGKSAAASAMEKDDLFDEAVAVILETGQASTSNLQRRLRLGYTRAARIIDQMEAEGLVGPAQGAKPRDIYVGLGDREVEPAQAE